MFDSNKLLFPNILNTNINVIKLMIKKLGIVKNPRLGTVDKNRRNNTINLVCIILIILAYLILFLTLRNRFLFTPDFGESDAYHLNLSLKYYLSTELKKNQIPFWTDALEGGYPLFSESQIGSLFGPNMFFLKFFDFINAYNLLFVTSLFFLSVGFFLLLRELGVEAIQSLLFSFIFTFNGSLTLRWVHLNLLQSFSMTPLLFFLCLRIYRTHSIRYYLSFIILFSQMLYAGHMQVAFIATLGLLSWNMAYVYIYYKKNWERLKQLLRLSGLIIGGIILALPQTLPNYLLSKNSNRLVTLDYSNATSFPFSWTEIISFVKPFAFGNPRLGTYPPFSSNWGIYWENTPYLGIIFFIILITSIFLLRKSLSLTIKFTLAFSGIFILLALGKNSPIYFIYNFPPFNFFRTPSKYLIMTNFMLILGLALLVDQLFKASINRMIKLLIFVLVCYVTIDLIKFTFQYHAYVPVKNVLRPPAVLRYVDSSTRYISFGQSEKWNEIFLKQGWENQSNIDDYLFFRNFLYPNSNLLFGKQLYGLNTGTFHLKRAEFLKGLLQRNPQDTYNLMRILGVGTIISSIPLEAKDISLIGTTSKGRTNIYVYRLLKVANKAYYIPHTLKKIEYLEEFKDKLNTKILSDEESVVENVGFGSWINDSRYVLKPIKESVYDSTYRGSFSKETFVVFRRNLYPEWSLFIDGRKTTIYPVNLVHMGIIVPKGTHTITMRYENKYFKFGLIGAFIFSAVFVCYWFYGLKRL